MQRNGYFQLVLKEVTEGGYGRITFNPPLNIDIYYGEESPGLIEYNLDCGMTFKLNLNAPFIKSGVLDEVVTQRLAFELFHAFFHYTGDPNYTTLNWALFGMLYHRVTCREAWGFMDDYTTDCWKYELGGKKISTMID